MATTSRGSGRTATKRPTATRKAKPAARRSAPKTTTLESVQESVGGYAGGFLKAVRARPYAAAALAAGAAGAGTFLWAKRALIGEQAAVAGEKLEALREQAGEQTSALSAKAGDRATALRGKFNERFFAADEATGFDPAAEVKRTGRPARKSQSEIAEEALSLKQTGQNEPLIAEQSKVGAVAY